MIVVINQSAVHNPHSAITLATDIYHASKKLPKDKLYSLTIQIRKSSRYKLSGFQIARPNVLFGTGGPTAGKAWNTLIMEHKFKRGNSLFKFI